MQNRRFEGEKSLSDKLEGLDSGYDVQDLKDFEAVLETTSNKSLVWMLLKYFAVFLLVGSSFFLFMKKGNKDMLEYREVSSENTIEHVEVNETENSLSGKNTENEFIGTEDSEDIIETKESTKNSLRSQIFKSENKARDEISEEPSSILKHTDGIPNENSRNRNGTYSPSANTANLNNSTYFSFDNEIKSFEQSDISNIEKVDKSQALLPASRLTARLTFELLPLKIINLENNEREFDDLMVEIKPIDIIKNASKRVSFGIQYNTGKTHAGAHETPFVSSFPTRIEGGKSFGYGFFGHVNLNDRSSIRPSFTYSKNTHLHFVEGLKFQTGPTEVNFELYSHELKFGLDYAFNFLPRLNLFDVKAGVGLAYHNIISLESNNYYTMAPEIVENANELDLSPFSYKLFLALDVPIYKSLILGIEPYIIYQKRRARYTPSTFIADQGDHNLISGINLTMRF